MYFNIDLILTILIFGLIIFIPLVFYAIHRLGIGQNEIKLFDDIEKESAQLEADLIANLNQNKNNVGHENDIQNKCVEIEKLLVDTAQLKFELIQKHNIDRIKLILTIFTVITTMIAALSTYKNYLGAADKERKSSLDNQFIELSQRVASANENEKEIAIIAFPRFALPNISRYQASSEIKKEYKDYDAFMFDFMRKYPYVAESTTIILNELEKKSVERARKQCKMHNASDDCEHIEDLYDYFEASFGGSVYANTIISSLNLITNETLQSDVVLNNGPNGKLKRERISAIDLRKKDFRGAYLRNADLEGMNGESVKFSFANLSGANLNYSYLRSAEIANANFRFASLRKSCLVASLVKGVDFTGANFEGADLRNSVLIESIFRNAFIANAKFSKTILYNAKFSGEKFKDMDKSIDELIKMDAITPLDCANFKDVRCEINAKCTNDSEKLPEFDGAIIDANNYSKLDFLNINYDYDELKKADIMNLGCVYAVKIYLINELNKNKKMGRLVKKNNHMRRI